MGKEGLFPNSFVQPENLIFKPDKDITMKKFTYYIDSSLIHLCEIFYMMTSDVLN